jgi:hypothetical protein
MRPDPCAVTHVLKLGAQAAHDPMLRNIRTHVKCQVIERISDPNQPNYVISYENDTLNYVELFACPCSWRRNKHKYMRIS